MPNWKYIETKFNKDMPMKRRGIVGDGGASKKKNPMIQRLLNIAYHTMDTTQAILIEAALTNLPKTTKKAFLGERTRRDTASFKANINAQTLNIQSKHQSANT